MRAAIWSLAVATVILTGMQSGPGLADADSQALGALPECNCDGMEQHLCKWWNPDDPECSGSGWCPSDTGDVEDTYYESENPKQYYCEDPDCHDEQPENYKYSYAPAGCTKGGS